MKKKLIIVSALSFLLAVLGYMLVDSYKFGLCFSDLNTNTYDVSCSISLEKIGSPLLYGMSALSAVFLILLVFPSAYSAWKKFAIWFVPIMSVIFVTYKGPSGGFMDPTPHSKQVFLWLSVLYVVVSFVIIIISLHKSKKIG